jgi:RNase H-fold protein (predicted Holliday junction resolvase)
MKAQELKNQKKEQQIDSMTAQEILNELKEKRLPTYGTA